MDVMASTELVLEHLISMGGDGLNESWTITKKCPWVKANKEILSKKCAVGAKVLILLDFSQ